MAKFLVMGSVSFEILIQITRTISTYDLKSKYQSSYYLTKVVPQDRRSEITSAFSTVSTRADQCTNGISGKNIDKVNLDLTLDNAQCSIKNK